MNSYFNKNACQDADAREHSLFTKLPDFLNFAKHECLHYQQTLNNIDVDKIDSRALLAKFCKS